MPELPEVETMARDLDRLVVGATIIDAKIAHAKLLVGCTPDRFARWVRGMTIERVYRRAKSVIIVEREGARRIIFAPRMTGEPRVAAPDAQPRPHEHLRLRLDDRRELRFADPRRFGRLTPAMADGERLLDLAGRDPFERVGPEPLEEQWSLARFRETLAARPRMRIKALLLDQRALAGVGNIYADEALWRASLHPVRLAGSLDEGEARELWSSLKELLATAVERRGSRVSTYRSPGGEASMQEELDVYGRGGAPCRRCGSPLHKGIVAGRGTHYCERCQPLP